MSVPHRCNKRSWLSVRQDRIGWCMQRYIIIYISCMVKHAMDNEIPLTSILCRSSHPKVIAPGRCGGLMVRMLGCFPFNQKFMTFRSEFKWKGLFWFVLTVIFRSTSLTGWTDWTGIYCSNFINWSVALLQLTDTWHWGKEHEWKGPFR